MPFILALKNTKDLEIHYVTNSNVKAWNKFFGKTCLLNIEVWVGLFERPVEQQQQKIQKMTRNEIKSR